MNVNEKIRSPESASLLALKQEINFDKISAQDLCSQILQMKENQKFLEMHKDKIYQGKGGLWYTYLLHDDGRKDCV